MSWKQTKQWAEKQGQRLATREEIRQMIAEKAGMSYYDEEKFESR